MPISMDRVWDRNDDWNQHRVRNRHGELRWDRYRHDDIDVGWGIEQSRNRRDQFHGIDCDPSFWRRPMDRDGDWNIKHYYWRRW